jgi:hypothetical protein
VLRIFIESKPMRLVILISTLLFMTTTTLFDFNKTSDTSNWRIVDDVVMGGRSNGSFEINTEGHGKFSGKKIMVDFHPYVTALKQKMFQSIAK